MAMVAIPMLYLILSYMFQWGSHPMPFVPTLLLVMLFVVVCLLFYKLIVEVDGRTLRLIYGIGLIRIKYKIDELERVEIIKTPWYYGLGIRITPKGMLYNIQGLKAVRIKYLRDGKRESVMVGSAEPEELMEALEDYFFANR